MNVRKPFDLLFAFLAMFSHLIVLSLDNNCMPSMIITSYLYKIFSSHTILSLISTLSFVILLDRLIGLTNNETNKALYSLKKFTVSIAQVV